MNVLFLSAWYPHRYDSMAGLFVQKHAEAVSLYADVKTLYVHADSSIDDFEIVVTPYNDIEEFRVYYPVSNRGFFSKIRKAVNYFGAYRKGFAAINKTGWRADILHTNVLTRTPFIGFLYKKLTGTPYVITEHWSKFLRVNDNFNDFFLKKILTKRVVKNAGYILPVSVELLDGLKYNNLLLTKYKIVENVVDKCFYCGYPIVEKGKKRMINVTCFSEIHKNLFGILRTVKAISTNRNDFEIMFIGVGNDYDMTRNYCNSLNIPDGIVHFAGLKTSEEVASIMQNSDFLVQFSNCESAGVVVQEALVSGMPVISTKVGVAPDFINETNGVLVDVKNEEQLIAAINYMLDNLERYDTKEIRKNASKTFSYERIGTKFTDVYNEVLHSTKNA